MDRPSPKQGPGTSLPWTWPLGGDVTQWIRTSWIKSLSDQTGFININNVRAGDPEAERRIIEDVASYGRQLGRIMEALGGAGMKRIDGLLRGVDRSRRHSLPGLTG
jgi:hypothetical protein